ncbi:Multidrug resistance-associated protein 4 [Chytridiales sp. JEL 0842]|nr:Multidrug resistance-associated protein 4 [Chytridiales sp. JEL 0842]
MSPPSPSTSSNETQQAPLTSPPSPILLPTSTQELLRESTTASSTPAFTSKDKKDDSAPFPILEHDDNDDDEQQQPPPPISQQKAQPPRRQETNFFIRWAFAYVNPVLKRGVAGELDGNDVMSIEDADKAHTLSTSILTSWEKELSTYHAHLLNEPNKPVNLHSPRLWYSTFKVFGLPYLWPGLASFVETIVKIAQALLLGYLLTWFSDPNSTLKEGLLWAMGLGLSALAHAVLHHVEFFLAMRVGMQMRVGFVGALYKKCLALSVSHTGSTGAILNLVSNDVQRFEDAAPFAHFVWLGPLEVLLITYFMYVEIGWAALAAVAALLGLIPLQGGFAREFGKLRKGTVQYRDERIKALSDSLVGVVVVKLYAWEEMFVERINGLRDQEMFVIRKASVLRALNEAFYFASSAVIEIFAFLTYWAIGGVFTPRKVFTVIVYLSTIRLSMTNFYPKALQFIAESLVSFQRIQQFLSLEEMKTRRNPEGERKLIEEVEKERGDGVELAVVVKNGWFRWGAGDGAWLVSAYKPNNKTLANSTPPTSPTSPNTDKHTLENINLTLPSGHLLAIVGPVGGGKSSFLHALLGEMDPSHPSTRLGLRSRKVAYCAQGAYILSGTVRDNICFGQPFDSARFQNAVSMCALERDLGLWSHGDMTVIGERGLTLSGGQKARLALARAVYADADLYLLDDPLSAVDAAVGRHLFEKCLLGLRNRGKTVILVTHQLQYVKRADKVAVMESGQIKAQGTWEDVVKSGSSEEGGEGGFAQVMKGFEEGVGAGEGADVDALMGGGASEEEEKKKKSEKELLVIEDVEGSSKGFEAKKRDDTTKVAKTEGDDDKRGGGMVKEDMAKGHVPVSTYMAFFRSGASIPVCIVLLFLLVIGEAALVCTDWYLSRWSLMTPEDQRWFGHALIFLALALGTLFVSVGRAVMFFTVCLNATEKLFRMMLASVFRSPMSFFQENPHGRVINRFSKDLSLSDEMLPLTFFDFIQCFFMIVGTAVVSVAVIPWVLLSVPFIAVVFHYLRKYYLSTSRQIKRLESVTRSPVYSTFAATLDGLATVRAYGSEHRFEQLFMDIQDENTRIYFCFLSCARWLGFRLDLLSASFLILVSFLTVGLRSTGAFGLNGGTVGLLLSYVLQLMGLIQWVVRQSAEVENLMVSVERILEYTQLPSEAPAYTDLKPSPDWPSRGEVVMNGLNLTYPSTNQRVLKDVSVVIPGGTKVGVVGRTGAGKSSLLQALFRLVEPEQPNSISIDGLNTGSLGLTDLRSKISIIPQEPFCFKGTLRSNLDPWGKHTDAELWRALESVELKSVVEVLPEKMDAPVAENGSNWSVGERQLICLARAILRNSKLIVMDEATSAVDMRTDALVQKAIRSETGLFATSTVLTIAHRLQTIIDFDRVLVLDGGRVVEYGTPYELLQKCVQDRSAWFARMVGEMSAEAQEQLRAVASEKELERTKQKKQ